MFKAVAMSCVLCGKAVTMFTVCAVKQGSKDVVCYPARKKRYTEKLRGKAVTMFAVCVTRQVGGGRFADRPGLHGLHAAHRLSLIHI